MPVLYPKPQKSLPRCALLRAQQRGRIAALDLVATLLLMQPGTLRTLVISAVIWFQVW